jgi:putative chitinase
MITTQQFNQLFPSCGTASNSLVEALNEVLPKYDINTPNRIASFIAQCGHESGGWKVFSENLNYSATGLDAIFGKYFKNAGRNSTEYAKKPEKIANVVYANRMGNGDVSSGDGWKYRGRGPIQLTGKQNYVSFSNDTGIDVVKNPDLVATDKKISILSAIWFWNKHKLNDFADKNDLRGMTKKINGGYNGLNDRISCYNCTLKLLGNNSFIKADDGVELDDDELDDNVSQTLRRGSRGDGVKIIQKKLGVSADGIFGVNTETVLKKWQKDHKLIVDGIAGPQTLDLLLG